MCESVRASLPFAIAPPLICRLWPDMIVLLDWRVGFSEWPPNCPFSLAHPVFACLRSAVAEIRSSRLVFWALGAVRLVFMADSLGDFVVVIGFANRFSNDEHAKAHTMNMAK